MSPDVNNSAEQKELDFRVRTNAGQAEIVRLLDETLEAEIDALRQSILKKAFFGQLVPQATDDESASALLEQIKDTRAQAPKAKKRKTAHA